MVAPVSLARLGSATFNAGTADTTRPSDNRISGRTASSRPWGRQFAQRAVHRVLIPDQWSASAARRAPCPCLDRPHGRVGGPRHESVGLRRPTLVASSGGDYVSFCMVSGSQEDGTRPRVSIGGLSAAAASHLVGATLRVLIGRTPSAPGSTSCGERSRLPAAPWWSAARRVSARRRCSTTPRPGCARAARHRRPGGVGVRLRVRPSAVRPLLPLVDSCRPRRRMRYTWRSGWRGRPAGPVPGRAGLPVTAQRGGREQPLLCVLDDVQWCDSASTDALLFASAGCPPTRWRSLFSVRDEPGADVVRAAGACPTSCPACPAGAVSSCSPGGRDPVPASVGAALVARTRGNPLALLELLARSAATSWPAASRCRTRCPWATGSNAPSWTGRGACRRGPAAAAGRCGRGVRRVRRHRAAARCARWPSRRPCGGGAVRPAGRVGGPARVLPPLARSAVYARAAP